MSVNKDQAIFDAIAAATSSTSQGSITINTQVFIDRFNAHRDRALCTSLNAAQAHQSAPPFAAPHNSGERLPSSDAADGGADTKAALAPERCAKCGRETKGEAVLVGMDVWCHPCADAKAPFHPLGNLPECMMPDGGNCCAGYSALVNDWDRLSRLVRVDTSLTQQLGRSIAENSKLKIRIADLERQLEARPSAKVMMFPTDGRNGK